MGPSPAGDEGEFPWWLLVACMLGAVFAWNIVADETYRQILGTLSRGIGVTVFVTLVSFALASALGLLLALCVLSRFVILRQVARFWIEIIRGVPMLVLLFYIAFVGAPALVAGWNAVAEPLGLDPIRTRDLSLIWRAILALTIGYSAFIAEVFRAGIQSVDGGQIEAAKALGLRPMGAVPADRAAAGAAHHPAAARQRFHRADQGQRAGLGARGGGHHAARQDLRGRIVPVFRDVQRGGVPVSGDDDRSLAGAPAIGAAAAGPAAGSVRRGTGSWGG